MSGELDHQYEADGVDGEDTNGTLTNSNNKINVKFLVSNPAAGSIIGKAGANIAEIQSQSSARVQLSRSNDVSSNGDRVLLLQGTLNEILTALHLVLTRITEEQGVLETMLGRDGKLQLRMLVPPTLTGAVIGKAGVTIRDFQADSKASINVSPNNESGQDRIVRMTGATDELLRAVVLVVTKLAANPNYARLVDGNVSAYRNGPQRRYSNNNAQGRGFDENAENVEVTVPVPDAQVGAIIGKGGEYINQMKNVVGVNISISSKGDFEPGTKNRIVRVIGTQDAVKIAQALIQKKLLESSPADGE